MLIIFYIYIFFSSNKNQFKTAFKRLGRGFSATWVGDFAAWLAILLLFRPPYNSSYFALCQENTWLLDDFLGANCSSSTIFEFS